MQKSDKDKLFEQFYLAKVDKNITQTSKYEKVHAYIKGCLIRKNKQLYKSQKYIAEDLQSIMDFDQQSANILFKQFPEIKYEYSEQDKSKRRIKVQCRKCGLYAPIFKFCPKCEEVHYCSQTCQVNVKLTHQKQECKINSYPKIHHSILIQVHFGTNLGHNIQIYFQHQARAYSLIRGKQIIKNAYQYFTNIKKTTNEDLRKSQLGRKARLQQKLLRYKVQLKNSQRSIEFQNKDESSYATGVLKVDLEDIDTLKRIYEQSEVLEEVELYLLREGALMSHCAEQIHNNHAHWVYIFRMP